MYGVMGFKSLSTPTIPQITPSPQIALISLGFMPLVSIQYFIPSITPVSYTHLDVYKRQVLEWRLF